MASRKVRRVPADWQHPRNEKGNYIPLFDGRDYPRLAAEWDEGAAQWARGFIQESAMSATVSWKPRGGRYDEKCETYAEWAGPRPDPASYAPDWPDDQRTHLMMYEDTSEGTPISPAFATAEELARWLADNGATCFAHHTLTYEEWLEVIGDGAFYAVFRAP